jgi:predicted RNase H-like nuclease
VIAVLGIDAAWTARQPSGVALVCSAGSGYRCVGVAPSYDSFRALARGVPVDWQAPVKGSMPDPEDLLDAARRLLGGGPVDIVTVDMPLATVPITGRRASDNAVSRAFNRRHCATHSPSAVRPGPIAAAIRDGFARQGLRLATAMTPAGTMPALLEVFPHPALLALLGRPMRVPYKVAKLARYWPDLDRARRLRRLLREWRAILAALARRIDGVAIPLPRAASALSLAALKRYEDALDAVVCAWIGTMYAEGKVKAYGDDASAIWVPVAERRESSQR